MMVCRCEATALSLPAPQPQVHIGQADDTNALKKRVGGTTQGESSPRAPERPLSANEAGSDTDNAADGTWRATRDLAHDLNVSAPAESPTLVGGYERGPDEAKPTATVSIPGPAPDRAGVLDRLEMGEISAEEALAELAS